MLIPVILAGGVGSRLWPVSRKALPKQFRAFANSDVTIDKASDKTAAASLFQQCLQRLAGIPGLTAPIVVCSSEHRFLVAEQLRQLAITDATIILEPAGRNTAPAVALASLAARERASAACMLVLAADHVIADVPAFRQAVATGQVGAEAGALVAFGIVPTRAETGYGYIRRGSAGPAFATHKVESFVEKPDLATAQQYLASGAYYWNSGIFMFTAEAWLRELGAFAPEILRVCTQAWQAATPDLDFTRIPAELFSSCPSRSIDCAVMEKTAGAVVVPLDAGWSDLGAWSSVWEHARQDANGNVCRGDVLLHDATTSYVQAESRLVALVGMENTIVVETPDAVLVAHKDRVQDVKEIVRRLGELQRPEAL